MQQRQGWIVAMGLSLLMIGATSLEATGSEALGPPLLADALSKEAIKKVRKDFDIVVVELDERDFPEAIDFLERAASSVEANRQYLGSEAEYTRLSALVAQAREAIKKKQFLPARRTIGEIMDLLGKLQASLPLGGARSL